MEHMRDHSLPATQRMPWLRSINALGLPTSCSARSVMTGGQVAVHWRLDTKKITLVRIS